MKLRKNRVDHVVRGGSSFERRIGALRSTIRIWIEPEDRIGSLGFRFVVRGQK